MFHFILISYTDQEGAPVCSVGIIMKSSQAKLKENIHSFAEGFPQNNISSFKKGGVKKGDSVSYWYFPIPFSMN